MERTKRQTKEYAIVTFRIEKDTYDLLRMEAQKQRRTMNNFVDYLLYTHFKGMNRKTKKIQEESDGQP